MGTHEAPPYISYGPDQYLRREGQSIVVVRLVDGVPSRPDTGITYDT